MYSHRSTHGPVDLAFTDRYGGVSAVPFDSLNLALEGGDDPGATSANLTRVLADFAPGAAVADLHQVHGAVVDVVDSLEDRQRPDADGVVTVRPDVVLMVRAADCVPVLLADPVAGVIGAAHSGRPGLAAGVVPATVTAMRQHGAVEITAWIGPHVCGGCYEVPAEMRDEVGALVPAAVATTTWGTPALDLGAGVRAQLEELGATVVDVSRCTRESDDLYSYRRDGARAGRLAGLIRLGAPVTERADEIAAGLDAVRRRIAEACRDAGRDPDEVTLVVVTKFFPTSDVRVLADLGVRHVGENRHQEAEAKAAECADLDLTWHYIGGLQSNKAAAVAAYADVVESVDRAKLLAGLSKGAHQRSHDLDCLVQVSLDPPDAGPGRAGVPVDELPDLAADLASRQMLRLRGLMAVAPLDEDPVAAFTRLAGVRRDFLADHPDATWLSAGMSGDLEAAIGCGATHVRIGRAVLGERPRIK